MKSTTSGHPQSASGFLKSTGGAPDFAHSTMFFPRLGFRLRWAVLIFILSQPKIVAAQNRFELANDASVVLLGGTFIERAQQFGHIETALTARFPKLNVRYRNLGWSADTVRAESRGIFDAPAKGYARMVDQIKAIKPTHLILNYGANESQDGAEKLNAFKTDFNKLIHDTRGEARLTIISPHRFEQKSPPLPNATTQHPNLLLYTNALRKMAAENDAAFADLMLADYGEQKNLTENGIHFTDAGYRVIAKILLKQLNVKYPRQVVSLQRSSAAKNVSQWNNTLSLLPWNGLTARFEGLPPGQHELHIDGMQVAAASHDQWARGVEISNGPDFEQLTKLRAAIVEKNRLYFYHWRPQNITYLFGFRKHEQGNNAKEVAEFTGLVKKLEQNIFSLRVPQERVWKLVSTP